MHSEFRDLAAYSGAAALADELHERMAQWPAIERWQLGIQLMRAVDSIGANIAEAAGRWHEPDKRRLLYIARGSLYETEHWMARAHVRGLLPDELSEQLNEVARALSGLIKTPTRR